MPVINRINIKHVVISRVDAIGDVVLTLPACIYLKSLYPDITISFLGRSYTAPVIKACEAISDFINYDEFKILNDADKVTFLKEKNIDTIVHEFPLESIARASKSAGIKIRIGITSKNYHFFTCNRLVRLSRRKSDLHEAQQNIYLLKPLGVTHVPTIGSIAQYYRSCFKPGNDFPADIKNSIQTDKFNLIIHSKSNGNGREWRLENFTDLINLLPADKFRVFITGSEKEHEVFKTWVPELPAHVIDVSGKLSVAELLAFIHHADGLLASSTGPLHLAAASGIHTLGLFPVTRAINAARWAPLGVKAEHIESDSDDLSSITVKDVYNRIIDWLQ